MFKNSNKEPQISLFGGTPSLLEGRSLKQFNNEKHWHNQFHKETFCRIDESPYKPLFNKRMGAPNASVSLLLGMMIIKEAFGWSDSQLFEQCRFNLLVRAALGLFNINDKVPAESTYYLTRKRIYEYQKEAGEDLLQKTYEQITGDQVKTFNVDGSSIRMDSKLFGSNIAYYSRYEIIHKTFVLFYKSLTKKEMSRIHRLIKDQVKDFIDEEASKTVYRSTKEEILKRGHSLGLLMNNMLNIFKGADTEAYQLLQRVFTEQYKIEDNQVQLRAKEEVKSSSVQSPHDPDSTFSGKYGKKTKGYSANVTETNGQGLKLITNIEIKGANFSDAFFVEPSIEATQKVTGQDVEKCYADGAYQSPANDQFCQNIDMVYTGLQGFASRYDLQLNGDIFTGTDRTTGEVYEGGLAKKIRGSKEDRYYLETAQGRKYFSQQAIRASNLRITLKERPANEIQKRNNVEASIFQLSYHLRKDKSKYRGEIKQKMWARCRGLWINLVRIINYTGGLCPNASKSIKNAPAMAFFVKIMAIYWIFITKIKLAEIFQRKSQLIPHI